MVALGNFFFHWRTKVSPLLLLLLFVPGAKVFADPFAAAILGLVVAFVGQVIRGTTIGYDYIVRGGRDHRVYADGLVTEGMFRHSRNPMYVGKFFMVLGAGIASNRWPSMLSISGAYLFMYQCVILAEEDYLRRKFGAAFDEYCRRVPRWLPSLRGIGETIAGSTFQWQRVIVKGYSEPLGWTLPIVGIGLYNLSRLGDLKDRPAQVTTLVVVFGVVIVFWLIAAILKRTRSPVLAAGR